MFRKGILISLLLVLPTVSYAGYEYCMDDCDSDYSSEITSCGLLWNDPDSLYMLRQCINNAIDDINQCREDCQ